MTVHIVTKPDQIAETVLMPGDPLRAKHIAETYLKKVTCYNEVRGALGYTGTYKGKKVSLQTSGMGMPSMSIYAHELIVDYGVRTLIRIGTTGAIQPDIKLRDVILAQSASTDSNMNRLRFEGKDFAASADFGLLRAAVSEAEKEHVPYHVGNILTSDTFYDDHPTAWKPFAKFGTLCIDMETAALYTIAARYRARALSLLSVSDHILQGQRVSAKERQESFNQMVEVALALV